MKRCFLPLFSPPLFLGMIATAPMSATTPTPVSSPADMVNAASPTNSPALPSASLPSSTPASPAPSSGPDADALIPHELKEIRGSISLPKDWSLITGNLLEGGVLVASREKIASENDSWMTGLTMTIDANGARDSGQPAGEYALGLAREARERAGDEASEITESRRGQIREFRFDYPLPGETPLIMTEILRADESNGVLTVILWQNPKGESSSLTSLREAILASIRS